MTWRIAIVALVWMLSIAGCRAATLREQEEAKLAKHKFTSDEQRLAFFQSESEKVELKVEPPKGTLRSMVEKEFGPSRPATDMTGHPRGSNLYDYKLADDVGMEVSYKDDKVQFASLFYNNVPKQMPLGFSSLELKSLELEEWHAQYIDSQVLLKTFKPKS